MASTEMLSNDHSWIISPPVTPRNSSNLSLNAVLNSLAEGSVLSSPAKAPSSEDLNHLNIKLTEVQLSSVEELIDDEFAAHNVRHEDAHGFVQDTSVSCLPRLRREGGVPILLDFTNVAFQSFEDTSSGKAKKTTSTVDEEAHSSGNDAARELPMFRRNGGDPMGCGFSHIDLTSSNETNNISSSIVDGKAHGFVGGAAVSLVPELQRGGGVPILLEVPFDCDPYFRPFYPSSDDANKTPSTTVDGKAHGSGDDATTKEFPAFDRNGWDPMGHDLSNVDLTVYLHGDTSFDVALTQSTSRL